MNIELKQNSESIFFPKWIPSLLNKITRGKMRDRISLCREDSTFVHLVMAVQRFRQMRDKPFIVRIQIILQKGQTAPDRDSIQKSLLDCLTKAGVIKSDSARFCINSPVSYSRVLTEHDEWGTIVTISDP